MYQAIEKLRRLGFQAFQQGRKGLLEHELYEVLHSAGLPVPDHIFVPFGAEFHLPDNWKHEELTIKTVSPDILHKTEIEGVRFIQKAQLTPNWLDSFHAEVAEKFERWYGRRPEISGALIAQRIEYDRERLSSEIILGMRWSPDFGFIGMLGLGGVKAEIWGSRLPWGEGNAFFSLACGDMAESLREISPTLVCWDLSGELRGSEKALEDDAWEPWIEFLRLMAEHFPVIGKPGNPSIVEMEFNPLVANRQGRLMPLDALMRLQPSQADAPPRPVEKLHKLFAPRTIAIAGVSGKGINMGRIILRNLLGKGFPAKCLFVIKPGEQEIDGVRCYGQIADLPLQTDLTVLAVGASAVPLLMQEFIRYRKTESIILIPGGMAEKSGGEMLQKQIEDMVRESRSEDWKGPVVCGPNSMGIYSSAGHYDTTFIPESKFPRFKGAVRNAAYISQSGAFMLSRVNDLPNIEPLYMVSIGNQMDLTVSDYLGYLRKDPEVHVLAVYVEGFQSGDGLRFLEESRAAIAAGKSVILYKGGRSPEGQVAAAGHTAALAGEYRIAWHLARSAGILVADTLREFEGLVKLAALLSKKPHRGNRLALMSNAGFEAVAMADSLLDLKGRLQLSCLKPQTRDRIRQVLAPAGIDTMINITNPLDITPSATDAMFRDCAQALLEDPDVDVVVAGIVPFSPVMSTLANSANAQDLLTHPESLANHLPRLFHSADRVLIAVVEGGQLYDELADILEARGVPVFRAADEAVRVLGKYLSAVPDSPCI